MIVQNCGTEPTFNNSLIKLATHGRENITLRCEMMSLDPA